MSQHLRNRESVANSQAPLKELQKKFGFEPDRLPSFYSVHDSGLEHSFNIVVFMDWSFASGCSPPRLSTTQLPSATDRPVFPSGKDFHPSVGAYFQAHLSTPLQFEYYLTRALEEAYKVGQKPVGTDMIENVLAKDINGLEPRLTRQGYNAKVLADLLNVKPREIKSFLSGHLAPGRTQELQTELLAAGIPL
jgi:hypothetical protein